MTKLRARIKRFFAIREARKRWPNRHQNRQGFHAYCREIEKINRRFRVTLKPLHSWEV